MSSISTLVTEGKLEVNMCKFTWSIEKFSTLCSNVKHVIKSPVFQVGANNEFQWRLKLYPFGRNDAYKDYISLLLYNESKINTDICFELTLSDKNSTIHMACKFQYNIQPGHGFGNPKCIKRYLLLQRNNGLPDDILNITCAIYKNLYNEKEIDIDKKILKNYKKLFYNENFSDLTIVINKDRMKVHKSILSARSRVFAAMLCNDMKENNTSTITVTDVSYNIMREFLLFIYSGQVNNLEQNARALLPVAEKYEIMDLKILCEKSIWRNVTIENACEILINADIYNCFQLKTQVIDYIVTNLKEINDTPAFKSLIRFKPDLFEKIMSAVVKKKF